MDFEEIYNAYFKDIYLFILAMSKNAEIAEEITQETFFKALKEIKHFRGNCSVKSWLCQIAKHLWYQWLDKRSRWNQTELTENVPSQESPEKATLLYMEKTALYQAIHALPDPMRELVYLRLTGEFSFAEIGRILGKSENWARTTFYRAKQKIMEKMEV